MKKTALTMTDSEKISTDKAPGLEDFHPKTYQEENQALRKIVEQQDIAMDMIMTKYREQVNSLTQVSHLDVRKLYYKRFLDTIVNQANKMDEMTTMMRKNLLIIFKYEEVMRQIESENESLRVLVGKLMLAAKEAERKADSIGKVIKIEAESQTHIQENTVSTADKSVGTSMCEYENPENGVLVPEIRDKCTDMIPYTPLSDSFAYCSAILETTRPPAKPLDVDSAFNLYVNRFREESQKPICESNSPHNIAFIELDGKSSSEAGITEKSEDSSEEFVSSTRALLTEVDELPSENSIVSLSDDRCSKEDLTKPVSDDVL